jgi:hypothetical protein
MNKESIIELQKTDCNCNDCKFMKRDFEKFNEALERHQTWQFSAFELKKKKLIKKSEEWANRGEYDKAKALFEEAEEMKFIFDKSGSMINYGDCLKFNKSVTFIPNTCQIETQECFKHRRD